MTNRLLTNPFQWIVTDISRRKGENLDSAANHFYEKRSIIRIPFAENQVISTKNCNRIFTFLQSFQANDRNDFS